MKTLIAFASLAVFAVPVYSAEPPSQWEVQGAIAGSVLLANNKHEIKVVRTGDEVEGCIATEERMLCDPAKIATFKMTTVKKEPTEIEKLTILLDRTKIENTELRAVLAKLNQRKNMAQKGASDGVTEERPSPYAPAILKQEDPLPVLQQVPTQKKKTPLVAALESQGNTVQSPGLGDIKVLAAGDRLLVRLARQFKDKANAQWEKVILEVEEDGGYVYYALDKRHIRKYYVNYDSKDE